MQQRVFVGPELGESSECTMVQGFLRFVDRRSRQVEDLVVGLSMDVVGNEVRVDGFQVFLCGVCSCDSKSAVQVVGIVAVEYNCFFCLGVGGCLVNAWRV